MTGPRRWPLVFIAAPAAVAVWSGWVGLGKLCGFGLVQPLPGIAKFHLDTAITLPVGVEAYGAYALGAWLTLGRDHPARAFARRSAIGSLVLGMLGQVVYHLLAAAHSHRAPWPVVVLVSCLPVVTLGFGAALTHLLRAVSEDAPERAPVRVPVPEAVPEAHPAPWPALAVPGPVAPVAGAPEAEAYPAVPEPPAALNGHGHQAAEMFAAELAGGDIPSIRRIRGGLHVGQDKARQVQAYLEQLTPAAASIRAMREEMRQDPGPLPQ